MKISRAFAIVLFVSSSAFAQDWDHAPVLKTPPDCVAAFAISLPGPWNVNGRDEKYVKSILNHKGYVSHYDAPCGPGPGICVGAQHYLSIYGVTHDMDNGRRIQPDELRLNVHHIQWKDVPGGQVAQNVGIYYTTTKKVSGSISKDRRSLIRMIEKIPACSELKLIEKRSCARDPNCQNGLYRSDWY